MTAGFYSWRLHVSQRHSLAIIGILFLLLTTVTLVAVIAEHHQVERLRVESEAQLNLFVSNVRSELDKYAFLPQVLASNERLISLLMEPNSSEKVSQVNLYLERVNAVANASDTYLMDTNGLTLAASNWASQRPFVGINFNYRPYFVDAMQGRPGRYYALGTTSNVRGYYYAYPVERGGRILGVIAVKVSLERIEVAWSRAAQKVVVTDRNGVIFITNYAPWRLRTMRPLPPAVSARLLASRQYGDELLQALEVMEEQPYGGGSRFLTIGDLPIDGEPSEGGATRYLVLSTQVGEEQWIVHMLADSASIAGQVIIAVLMTSVVIAVIVLGIYILLQRRRILREKLVNQQRVEAKLQEAHAELEERVRERTADLLRINRELDREVVGHKQAEDDLRQAQAELIQAAKLAVIGQMSAGITHELNQPLAAIKSYADNALVFLERDSQGQAAENLAIISELTDRMAQITGHLKTFARKSDNRIDAVDFNLRLSNALVLLAPRLRKQGIRVHECRAEAPAMIRADAVRIEQVLVNLLANAADAMSINGGQDLYLDLDCDRGRLRLTVRDTGPGIDTEHLPQLFDPFFTTKQVGEGLGLGLSISYGIINDFGGELSAANHPDGGAVFRISMALVDDGREDVA